MTPKPSSDSGTDADDEGPGLLKGLPAPQVSHRRRQERDQSRSRKSRPNAGRRDSSEEADSDTADGRDGASVRKKKRLEVLRRILETAMVLSVGATVLSQGDARAAASSWDKGMSRSRLNDSELNYADYPLILELITFGLLIVGLYALFPLRMYPPGFHLPSWVHAASFPFTAKFDPAPLLYPILLPIIIVLSLGTECRHLILPNIILSLCSLPFRVVPFYDTLHGLSVTQWAVTAIPLFICELPFPSADYIRPLFLLGLNREILVSLFPLQQALVSILQFLTTTSLLTSELQLLATGLINLLLFAKSPQAEIQKALLWVGGTLIFLTCRHVCRWEVALARVPSWKFRRSAGGTGQSGHLLKSLDRQLCQKLSPGITERALSDSDDFRQGSFLTRRSKTSNLEENPGASNVCADMPFEKTAPLEEKKVTPLASNEQVSEDIPAPLNRVKTAPPKMTPRGRRKRTIGPELRSFMSLTVAQAKVRKWAYAIYVYAAIAFIVIGPVRAYVGDFALRGNEPFGWAVGYLFGNIQSLRFWLVKNNFDRWACLPPRVDEPTCHLGWMEHLRRDTFGEANTRLILSGYYLPTLFVGLLLVIQLSAVAAVDTRRKVFHGMIAMMLLPTVYVDPAFTGLALAIILTVFLLLDIFRASQLPPISKPLTYFLSPYVDGRDHRGPVIVSHMFLLLGCGIPLWLSLASSPRTGSPPWEGWEVRGRDVSMVSGVVCVGLGDAAASLVGRRYGRSKWFWGGGKSLEGSFAFAVVVTVGLVVAKLWLVIGGWEVKPGQGSTASMSFSLRDPAVVRAWFDTTCKAALAAAGSSFTEAVVTGGNDNVVVPLVLWLLVRGLNI